ITAITAAMPAGTGLCAFKKQFPDRFFDVGIAEQHAVTMAAGMASAGLRPVFAVYSTFLQRGYDQLLHDVCLQKLPVVFGVDRAGLVGADGETHQGVYDIAYFSTLPNGFKLLSPSSQEELTAMLGYALTLDSPCAVRYSRGLLPSRKLNTAVPLDEWEMVKNIKPCTVVASGRLLENAEKACEGLPVGLINARLLCPLGQKELRMLDGARCVITVEDGSRDSGFGAQLARLACAEGNLRVLTLGVPSVPICAATPAEQDELCGLTVDQIRQVVLKYMR
ncbi:MAG: 1-deoxy-D-xylulose-5-phosphate synthase, partial [Clostridia bacterium]|nr:1-deoxy-D-xylulose-5-phosphate synthase [Clostridia bacterium]